MLMKEVIIRNQHVDRAMVDVSFLHNLQKEGNPGASAVGTWCRGHRRCRYSWRVRSRCVEARFHFLQSGVRVRVGVQRLVLDVVLVEIQGVVGDVGVQLQPLQFHDGNTVFERNGGQFHCGGVTTEGGVSKSLGEASACRTKKGFREASLNMAPSKQVHPRSCVRGGCAVTPALDVCAAWRQRA